MGEGWAEEGGGGGEEVRPTCGPVVCVLLLTQRSLVQIHPLSSSSSGSRLRMAPLSKFGSTPARPNCQHRRSL